MRIPHIVISANSRVRGEWKYHKFRREHKYKINHQCYAKCRRNQPFKSLPDTNCISGSIIVADNGLRSLCKPLCRQHKKLHKRR